MSTTKKNFHTNINKQNNRSPKIGIAPLLELNKRHLTDQAVIAHDDSLILPLTKRPQLDRPALQVSMVALDNTW